MELEAIDVDEMVRRFYGRLNDVISRRVPIRRLRNHKQPAWFSELLAMPRRQAKSHKRYKCTGNTGDSKRLLRKCEKSYLANIQTMSKTQIKPFWSYVKSLGKSNTIPDIKGFLCSHSTLTNLMEFVQHASDVVDAGSQLDVVYLDISKAFDQVPHCFCFFKNVSDMDLLNLRLTYCDRTSQADRIKSS